MTKPREFDDSRGFFFCWNIAGARDGNIAERQCVGLVVRGPAVPPLVPFVPANELGAIEALARERTWRGLPLHDLSSILYLHATLLLFAVLFTLWLETSDA